MKRKREEEKDVELSTKSKRRKIAEKGDKKAIVLIQELFVNGQYSDAIELLNIFPKKRNELYCLLAVCYDQTGRYEKSIECCDKAIRIDPTKIVHYFCRALSYENMKEYKKAIIDYSKCIDMEPNYRFQMDPNYPSYYCRRGYSYYQEEQYNKAIEDLDLSLVFFNLIKDNIDFTIEGYFSRNPYYFKALCFLEKKLYSKAFCICDFLGTRNREKVYKKCVNRITHHHLHNDDQKLFREYHRNELLNELHTVNFQISQINNNL